MCVYDVYGPCSCPHGRCFTILAQCFTISSFVTSVVAITSCFYIFVRPIPEEGEPEKPREGFGYFSRQTAHLEPADYQQCVFYSQDEQDEYFDSMWRAGMAMSLLASVVGGVAMCIVLCTCCVAFQLPTFDGLFWTCMFCFVAQSLTFLAWGSQLCDDYECTWSSGTGMNITAALLWVWAANMIKSFPEALPPRGRGRRKAPIYEDDEDAWTDHDGSAYLNPSQRSGFYDEYDESRDGSMMDMQDQSQYRDGYYDDGTYDDGTYGADGSEYGEMYDDQGYPMSTSASGDSHYSTSQDTSGQYGEDPYYSNPYDNYVDNTYEDPEEKTDENEFEPSDEFRSSWRDSGDDEPEEFDPDDASGANYFSGANASNSVSQEEMEFLGGGNRHKLD